MVRHKSAIRQQRRSLRRKSVNQKNRSILRSQIKTVKEAIQNKDKEKSGDFLSTAFSVIDKTVKKGTIHPNKGARYKSRLSRQVKKMSSASSK